MNDRLRRTWHALDRDRAWRRAADQAAERIYDETTCPYADLPLGFADDRVDRSFARWRADEQRAYLYRYRGRALLEPEHGFLLTDRRTLLPASMPYHFYVSLPSFTRHLRRLARRRPVVREDVVISLRDFEDANYYHFYNDVLGKLALLERFRISTDARLVISRRLSEQPFFRDALARSPIMRAKRWLIHDDCYIEAREVIFCQAMPHDRRNFDYALGLLDAPAAPSETGDADDARIFLTRRPPRARHLANAAEIEATCAAFGFRIVDADRLTLDEQISLFSRTRHLVGIHGAGLTNIIFRRGAGLSLLELFPPDQIPPHYCRLARSYGFRYDALTGYAAAAQSFAVDAEQLERRLEHLLTSDAPATAASPISTEP